VYVTWEIGSNSGLPPFAKTQNDTMKFKVGWGIYTDYLHIPSLDIVLDKAEYYKSENVIIKVNIHNQYMIPVNVLVTADMFDDLMVPIGGVAYAYVLVPGSGVFCSEGNLTVTFAGLHVEKWAFAGLGTVKVNEFTAWPSAMGTAWCPEQVATFVIKKTFNPPDP